MEKTMKKNILLFTCFLCLTFAGLQARAQNPVDQAASQASSTASQVKDQTANAMGDTETKAKVQAKLEKLSSDLNLTDEQKTQIKPILQGEYKELKGVNGDSSLSDDQKKSKMAEVHESSKSQISAILTPEQKTKLAAMKSGDDQ
jgi:Spy/CpxP family protein refolding chaperone